MSKLRLVSTVLNYRFKNTRLFRVKIPCQENKAFPLYEGKNNTKQQGDTITFVLLINYAHIVNLNTLSVSCY